MQCIQASVNCIMCTCVQMLPEGILDRPSNRRTSQSSANDDVPRYHSPDSTIIEVYIAVNEPTTSITEFTDESYQLAISSVTMVIQLFSHRSVASRVQNPLSFMLCCCRSTIK